MGTSILLSSSPALPASRSHIHNIYTYTLHTYTLHALHTYTLHTTQQFSPLNSHLYIYIYTTYIYILYFRAPERDDRRVWNHWPRPVCCVFGAPQTSPPRISALAGISEPQRGPTGGYRIIGLACGAAILVLPRRVPQDLDSESQRWPTGGYGIIVSPQDLGHTIGQSASQSLAS